MRSVTLKSLTFPQFLAEWRFVNRETGDVLTFAGANLWDGQRALAGAMVDHLRLYALKAGKLGFTELACAWDAWRALYGPPNSRIHLFSRDQRASRDLLSYIKYGLTHPDCSYRVDITDEPGGNLLEQLRFRLGADDVRTIVSYAAGPVVSIDQSCQHAHVDELAQMPFPRETWDTVISTVAPGGSVHIVTRGRPGYAAELWEQITANPAQLEKQALSEVKGDQLALYPFFSDFTARPERDEAWRTAQGQTMTPQGLAHFAPRNPQEALAGETGTLIYPMYEPLAHIRPNPCDWKDYTKRYAAVDLGGTDPTVAVVSGLYRNSQLQHHALFWRAGGSGATVADIVDWLWKYQQQAPFRWVVIDPPVQSVVDYFRAQKLPAKGREGKKWEGIEQVANLLGLRIMFHDKSMESQVTREYHSYRSRERLDPYSRERYQTMTPVDHHGDTLDCIRYIVREVLADGFIYRSSVTAVKPTWGKKAYK